MALNETRERWETEYMEKEEHTECLPYDLQVILPRKCPRCKEANKMLIEGMTNLFGGTTIYEAVGTWVDRKGHVVEDDNIVVESAHSCMDDEMAAKFYSLVMQCATIADQSAVSLKQGKFYMRALKDEEGRPTPVSKHLSLVPITKRTSYGEGRESVMGWEQ